MSIYKINKYIEHIPEVMGQKKEKKDIDPRDEEFRKKYKNGIPNTDRIDDNKELIKQAKELGLKTPNFY